MNLELELTEVKENLKKALSGGVTLGLTIQPKSGSSGLQVSSRPVFLLLLFLFPHGPSAHSAVCRSVSAVARRVAADSGVLAVFQLRHQRHGVVLPARQQRLAAPPPAARPEALGGAGTRPEEGQGQSWVT